MDFLSPTREKQEPLLAVTSPVEETKLGQPPAVLAGLATVIPFLGSLLGLVEREQPYVKHYAIQGLLFWLVTFVVFWLSKILLMGEGPVGVVLHLIFIIPFCVIFLALFFLLMLMASNAFNGAVYYLPFTRKFLVGPLDPLRNQRRAHK